MKRQLHVGVIGLGRISPRHIDDSILTIPQLKLAAVCDIDKNLAKSVGKKYKVPFYSNYLDLIHSKSVDIVSICTPNGWHHRMGMAVAKANKHCIMEKPISLNYSEAKKLVSAFEKSKGSLFPVLQVRYNPTIKVLREHILGGRLGKILTASVTIRWSRPQEYFTGWHGTKEMDGGTLLTQGIHYIDIMQYVLGKPQSVFAKSDTVAHDIPVEDISNAIIDLQTGTRVNMEFTVCTYPHNLECSLTVLGEKGTIKIGGTAMNVCETWEVKDTPRPVISEGLTPNQYAGGAYVGSCPNHNSIYANLVNTLIYKKENEIPGREALESLRIIDAIRKSSMERQEILLNTNEK